MVEFITNHWILIVVLVAMVVLFAVLKSAEDDWERNERGE